MDIRFEKREHLKEKPDQKHLGFGKYMTDYMFVMDWTKEEGWKDARIVPEGPITMDPACVTLHYAQETFEGMKAYRTAEGKIQLFRPEMNAKRMINSNARLCMPELPVDMFVEAVKALVVRQQGVLALDDIKTRMFGNKAYVDIEIAVDGNLLLKEAHNIAEKVHDEVEHNFPEVKHCMVHVNPY